MNGNELANILKYSGGEWRAGELLPKEWWKKDFPYGEAEKMGYRMSPEEIRSRKRKEKSISEQMADILRSKDFMMLNAADRMKVMETVRKIQEAEAKGKREREKHETEMLEIGRQTQMQAKVKAILESDRVPAQKVTALTMAGIPLTDARDMVWGKRAPGEEAGRAGRAATPTARAKPTGEELATALRPEKRGVQFRMIGEELIKERAGIWEEERLTPEQRIAKREEERKGAEHYRGLTVKRERPEMFVPLEERKFTAEKKQWTKEFGAKRADAMFDQKMRGLEYEAKVKEEDRQYELNVEEFGEEKAENLRSYNLDKLKGDRTWEETLLNMGFKDKEFVELSRRFWGELDFNKEKEKIRAEEFNVEVEWDKEKEANVMDRFEAKLEQEYKTLDLDIKRLGLNKEIEARIAKMALLQFTLDEKKLGLDEVVAKWKRIAEKKEWYFREEELKLKDTQAQRLFKELMHRITQDAKEFGLKEAIHKENMRQFDEKQKVEWEKLEGTPEARIEIGGSFGVDLSGLGTELQDEVMGYIKSTYNPKTGKTFFPSVTYMKQINGFLFDTKDGKKKKEELGCNLTSTDYMKAVAKQSWPDEVKGWCIRTRYNENLWQGVCEAGAAEEVYISPEEAMKPGLWEKITDWWPFGKEKKKPTEIDFPAMKAEVDRIYDETGSIRPVTEYLESIGITLDEYKEWLRGRR